MRGSQRAKLERKTVVTRLLRTLSATLLLAGLALPLAAQPTAPARLHTELHRIREGYKNGTINNTKFKTDMVRWRGIRRQMRHDWHHDNGPMTNGQRKAIYRDERRLGERIHDQRQRPPQ